MFKKYISSKHYYDNDTMNQFTAITKLLLLASIFLVIISSFIYSLYEFTRNIGILFDVGIFFIIASDAVYALNNIMFFQSDKFKISDKFILFSFLMFFLIFISDIFISISLRINITSGIIGIIGVILGVLYFYFKSDKIVSRMLMIISLFLVSLSIVGFPIRLYSGILPFYMNSATWAQAFIIFQIFMLLSYLFRENNIINDFLISSGRDISIFIFGIGMLIAGSAFVTFPYLKITLFVAIPEQIILVLAGIGILIAGIFTVIISIMDFYYEVIKPRIFMR